MKPYSLALVLLIAGCNRGAAPAADRATGYIEATEVRVAAEVGGRLLEVKVRKGIASPPATSWPGSTRRTRTWSCGA